MNTSNTNYVSPADVGMEYSDQFHLSDFVRVVKSNYPEGEFMVGHIGEIVGITSNGISMGMVVDDNDGFSVDFGNDGILFCDANELVLVQINSL